MAVKFEKVEPGMTLYDRHRYRMGNTTLTSIGEWEVRVISVDKEARTAMCSWNGNPPRRYYARDFERLSTWSKDDPGVIVETGMLGSIVKVRKMTKAERAAAEAK